VNLSQQELANLIGASREIVNRWLGRLAKKRLLRHQRGVLTILDEDRLRLLSESPPSAPRRASPLRRRRRPRRQEDRGTR